MFRQPISISRATFFVFLRVFFGVLKIAAGPKGSSGRQNQMTRAAGFEARLRGEAEQPSDDWQRARASDTGVANLPKFAGNIDTQFRGHIRSRQARTTCRFGLSTLRHSGQPAGSKGAPASDPKTGLQM